MGTGETREGGLLRGAIVGFGNAAIKGHLPSYLGNPYLQLVALAEPDAKQRVMAARHLPHVPVYSDLQSLIGRENIDFVDVCAPPFVHRSITELAWRSGLHVLCEKPFPDLMPEWWDGQNGTGQPVIFVVNNWKYAPLWLDVRRLVTDGAIGAVRTIDLNVERTWDWGGSITNWRRSAKIAMGGILLDHGWHQIYLALSIVEGQPESVAATLDFADIPCSVEHSGKVIIRFHEAEARIALTWRASRRRNSGLIRGEQGDIWIEDDHLVLKRIDGSSEIHRFEEALSGSSHHPQWTALTIDAFRLEVADPQSRGASLTEASTCAVITRLAYESCRRGSVLLPVEDYYG